MSFPLCYGLEDSTCAEDNTCACFDPEKYILDNECVPGCPGLNQSHGRCVGVNDAVCFNNWTSVDGLCDQCLSGYVIKNERCVKLEDTCYEGRCVHGACIDGKKIKCQCENSWSGDHCDQCNLYGEDCNMTFEQCSEGCNGHGLCVRTESSECACSSNFTGMHCESCEAGLYLKECIIPALCGALMCSNHGVCTGDSMEPSCVCEGQWTGADCSICAGFGSLCDLTDEECSHSYCPLCLAPDNCECAGNRLAPVCACKEGFFGNGCDMTAQECASSLCGGHGVCVDGIWPKCVCSGLWEGKTCSSCDYYGPDCALSKGECAVQFCAGNGACEGFGDATRCVCQGNFSPDDNCAVCAEGFSLISRNCALKSHTDEIAIGVCVAVGLAVIAAAVAVFLCLKKGLHLEEKAGLVAGEEDQV